MTKSVSFSDIIGAKLSDKNNFLKIAYFEKELKNTSFVFCCKKMVWKRELKYILVDCKEASEAKRWVDRINLES